MNSNVLEIIKHPISVSFPNCISHEMYWIKFREVTCINWSLSEDNQHERYGWFIFSKTYIISLLPCLHDRYHFHRGPGSFGFKQPWRINRPLPMINRETGIYNCTLCWRTHSRTNDRKKPRRETWNHTPRSRRERSSVTVRLIRTKHSSISEGISGWDSLVIRNFLLRSMRLSRRKISDLGLFSRRRLILTSCVAMMCHTR